MGSDAFFFIQLGVLCRQYFYPSVSCPL